LALLFSGRPQVGCGWSCIKGCIEYAPLPAPVVCRAASGTTTDDLGDYPKKGGELRKLLNANREDDKKQLGNALIAWAMLTAIEIETELGAAPAPSEQEHTPRRSDLLIKAVAELQS
jgi:hypothetical protein